MKNKTQLFSFLFFLSCLTAFSQENGKSVTNYQSFNFFYVDNSHGARTLGMNDSLFSRMRFEIKKLLKQNDKGFLLFRSNGNKPQIIQDKSEIFNPEFRTELFNQEAAIPNFNDDRKAIRNLIYDTPIHVTSSLNFHFFLSEASLSTMMDENPNSIMINFIRELALSVGDPGTEVNVTLYFSKDINSVNESSIYKFLSYFNGTLTVPLKINYSIVQS